MREAYARYDAERKFAVPALKIADPKSFQCGEVLKGVIKPWQCKVFAHVDFDIGRCEAMAREVNPEIRSIRLSARSGEDEWYEYLRGKRQRIALAAAQ
jgi:hypothetical protein